MLHKLAEEASRTPLIWIGGTYPPPDPWQHPREETHRIALLHGLPEIEGFYGLNDEGEFLVADGE